MSDLDQAGHGREVDPAKVDSEPCLELFITDSDAVCSNKRYLYRCGMRKHHNGSHCWRGDLDGGLVGEILGVQT